MVVIIEEVVDGDFVLLGVHNSSASNDVENVGGPAVMPDDEHGRAVLRHQLAVQTNCWSRPSVAEFEQRYGRLGPSSRWGDRFWAGFSVTVQEYWARQTKLTWVKDLPILKLGYFIVPEPFGKAPCQHLRPFGPVGNHRRYPVYAYTDKLSPLVANHFYIVCYHMAEMQVKPWRVHDSWLEFFDNDI